MNDMNDTPPWHWPESAWRQRVGKVAAGRSLKPSVWKNGAQVAVALSFDADQETVELRTGGASIGKLNQGHYGARVGMGRILETLGRHGVPATVFTPAVAALLHAGQTEQITSQGHEIALHGWIHEFNSKLDEATERDLALKSADALERITGIRPVGMRTPAWDFSDHTLKIAREMGLLYDSSLMADDDPYELLEDNQPTGVVEIPVEWIRDDAAYLMWNPAIGARPYTPPSQLLDIFIREFDRAALEGGLFQLTLHPHIIGHRSRMFVLDELIAHMKSRSDVWFATHRDIAEFCAGKP